MEKKYENKIVAEHLTKAEKNIGRITWAKSGRFEARRYSDVPDSEFPGGGGDMRKIWIVFAAEIRKHQQHN